MCGIFEVNISMLEERFQTLFSFEVWTTKEIRAINTIHNNIVHWF